MKLNRLLNTQWLSISTALTLVLSSVGFADPLNYPSVVDLAQYRGTPIFEVMRTVIKPQLDRKAVEGFYVADGRTVVRALDQVDDKVARSALRGLGVEGLGRLADSLNRRGRPITFYDLPEVIASTPGFRGDRYDLTTYLSLVSGGGVAVKIAEDVYAYNVNYGTGQRDKDEMTGRSFGAAGQYHKAFDASDAAYLRALEKIARPRVPDNGREIMAFMRTILEVITKSDATGFNYLSPESKAVASDFLAVYMAEQDRHLMVNLRTHHWDSALLEVTLLAAFHAGQERLAMVFEHEQDRYIFTDRVVDQIGRRRTPADLTLRPAGMVDYWQFSTNPENPNRSGINITRGAFSRLERKITEYVRRTRPGLVENIERIVQRRGNPNVFDAVSDYLINFNTQASVARNADALVAAYMEFLNQIRVDAPAITRELQQTRF